MIWQLMKRDPAWRRMPATTLAVGAICALLHFFARSDGSLFSTVLFGGLMGFLAATLFEQCQDTPFQANLPATVRQVLVARTLCSLALLWLPVIAGLVTLAALRDRRVSVLPLDSWSAVTCGMLTMQCVFIRYLIVPRWLRSASFGVGLMVMSVFRDGLMGRYGLVVPAALSLAFILRTWQTVPKSFQFAPTKASVATVSKTDSGGARWKPALLPIFELSELRFVIVLFGLMLFGPASPFWCPVLIFQWSANRVQIRWISALPVSPRVLLAGILLPTVAGVCLGYSIGIRLPWLPLPYFRGVSVRSTQYPIGVRAAAATPDCKTLNVLPSLEYWIPTRSGKAPLIEAPWGETFQPSVIGLSGYDAYNPYAVGCDNTRRFLDWQFKRATVAVYGRPIALDHKVDPVVEETAISGLRTQFVCIAGLAGFSLLSFLVAMVFDWSRFRRLGEAQRTMFTWVVGVAAFGLFGSVTFGGIDIVQWLSWTLPGSFWGSVAVMLPLLALLYLATNTLFGQLEFADRVQTARE